jgi:hypothetical protein
MGEAGDGRRSLAGLLALNRTVAVVLLAVLLFGLGEQLWEPFLPVYLKAGSKELARGAATQGVPAAALLTVGLFAALLNLFEAGCYVGGGGLTARLGDRGSLLLFGGLSVAGYGLFLLSASPLAAVPAALLILGWEPLAVPATFTTVGSTVSTGGRGMAFALQSIQKRLPKVIGPLAAGFVLTRARAAWGDDEGVVVGMRILVSVALGLGVVSLAASWAFLPHREPPPPGPPARALLRSLHPGLRRLLLAEALTRWCDWLARPFVVLYIVFVRGVDLTEAGALLALQHLTALLTYLPVGGLTRGRDARPFIGLTFVFFALFPLALALLPTPWLAAAFVICGLREIGEPARKALITSLLPAEVRARGVGLYWGLRSLALCPAALAGAALWWWAGPTALLLAAFACGCGGAAVFYLLARRAAVAAPAPAPVQ